MHNSRIEELLIDWEVARQSGKVLTAKELCADAPELENEVDERIQQLLQTSWMMEDSAVSSPIGDVNSEPKRPSNVSLEEFVDKIRNHQLFSDSQAKKYLDDQTTSKFSSAEDCANELVAEGALSRYQSDALLGFELGPLRLDRYTIVDTIGAGGMGVIYRALHQSMNRYVAIKTLPAQSFSTDRMERFKREMQAAAKLNHPNIVRAYDAHESDGIHFLVMELIEGDDLSTIIREQGPLNYPQACKISAQIASALQAAHRVGIIHRDVKPSNILLNKKGDAKLLDMGLARFKHESFEQTFTSSELSKFGMPMGTVAYMAPEQAVNASDAGAAADVYALGCTLHQLLTGNPPFDDPSPIQVIIDHREKPIDQQALTGRWKIPEPLVQILQKMMAKAPADRFESMAAVQTALLQFAELDHTSSPVATAATTSTVKARGLADRSRANPPAKPNATTGKPWAIFIAGLILLVATCLAGWFAYRGPATDGFAQADVVKWSLNQGAYLTIKSDLGVQEIEDARSVPDGEFQLTGIEFLDLADDEVPMKLFSPNIPLTTLSLSNTTVTDEVAQAISSHPTLRKIDFFSCKLKCNPESWSHLQNITRLQIEACNLTGDALPFINQLAKLEELYLPDNTVDDEKLLSLGEAKSLVKLDLSHNPISSKSVLELVKHLPQLTVLDVGEIEFSLEDTESLMGGTSLEYLAMNYSMINDAFVLKIATATELTDLLLNDSAITDKAVDALLSMKRLDFLDLSNTEISDDAIKSLAKISTLTYLRLNDTDVSDLSANDWAAFSALKDLELDNTLISNKTLRQLAKLSLNSLSISRCDVSDEAVERFLIEAPDCTVYQQE